MSGYRSIHREAVLENTSIWSVQATDLLTATTTAASANTKTSCWRIWAACSDGIVRSYVVQEKAPHQAASATTSTTTRTSADPLDASALKLHCTHELGEAPCPLGCTRVCVVRNYVGDDDRAGDLVVASLGLAGKVSIWQLAHDMDKDWNINNNRTNAVVIQTMKPLAEFTVENATGTTLCLCPPRVSGVGAVAVAVGCLDGTIAIVATGLATPNHTAAVASTTSKQAKAAAGTRLDTWASQGSAVPLSLAWHPRAAHCLAVGRQDGLVEIVTGSRKNQHRLTLHKNPVRALSFTDDGALLLAGADDGFIAVWDVGRAAPVLVHHVRRAHTSWILDLAVLLPDSQRFVTVGAEKQIHVWNMGHQLYQPLHTFHTDQSVWCVQRGPRNVPRLVAGSDTGGLQIYSLES